ncbi:bifunctional phosphopantothenoylcysteine decarboxylase/phosphopantothenate--cysteine ligase CoaBC [Lacticaseibacillus nasuensis]|uniref:Coenzyme A biosynthesis bifunctional protein CoaBC n=2 Tax=Lacticaseibacillus TaxID=2759736 RepID=A0A0R1JSP3_9LACO|nr:bifunctional phosphopantothenoylcysteine decarboxylase/phosphopantothenate--cysteine ligase CoaBC [Lacticaseibacillus nasuensis]KRK74303.1 phosphopantothenoylcysteinesynthetase decarboxyla se [Lacticaseibacillus nasuensis JCM 17158]
MTGKHIGLFITGGIAAYKMPALVRALIRAGHEVKTVVTPSALEFVTAASLATVSKHAVLTDANATADPTHVAHVALAQWLDLAVVVPATANTIAKLAHGLADNIVTTSLLAFNGPKLVVPAMNDQMWLNPLTQANVATLAQAGYHILPPATGFLAEGYSAVGRMPDLPVIEAAIATLQPTAWLAGKRVLVSAGGTRERLDPVRYLTNDSSGKMGTALANVAAAAGAAVTLVTTASQPVLPNVKVQAVATAAELAAAMQTEYAAADIVIMAAAVADFRPAQSADHKLKKATPTAGMTLELVANPDILAGLGQTKTHQYLAGFAAETDDLIQNATAKLAKKGADLIVANEVGHGRGFNAPDNAAVLLRPHRAPVTLAMQPKVELAAAILRAIAQDLEGR